MKVTLCCILACLSCISALAQDTTRLRELVSANVVLVRAVDDREGVLRSGTGVVTGRGQVVTACHIVAQAKGVQVKHQDVIYPATLQYADVERDLCQLSARKVPAPGVALGGLQAVRLNQRVYVAGYAGTPELFFNEGTVSVLRDYHGMPIIQSSVTAPEGAREAALFDDEGRLIGMTTTLVPDASGTVALAADAIMDIPKRVQGAVARQSVPASSRTSVAAGSGVYKAEWASRIALLEKAQGDLTLSQALATLLDITNENELGSLAKHEAEMRRKPWHNSYAIGTDGGHLVWGGCSRCLTSDEAVENAINQCKGESLSSCRVVLLDGDFQAAQFLDVAKRLGRENVAAVRQAFLQTLTISPKEAKVGLAPGGSGGREAESPTGFSSAR